MTVQDHAPLDTFINSTLSWQNTEDPTDFQYDTEIKDYVSDGHSNFIRFNIVLNKASYTMNLKYYYTDNTPETLNIRIYRKEVVNYWLPYDN